MELVVIYWDKQDPQNEGWAYRVRYADGREESGKWEALPTEAMLMHLREAVVACAHQHGATIREDEVVAHPSTDGGYAEWIG